MKEILAIIPSRYASTRLPGKPLALVGGVPMVVRTLRQAAKVFTDVCVATDDERIKEVVEKWGGVAVMTSSTHPSGTDRCLEALQKYSEQTGRTFKVVVNVQGDEPFISTNQLEKLAACFDDESVCLATIVKRASTFAEVDDVNRPKVVVDDNWNALYFSRNRIPYDRSGCIDSSSFFLHVGLYGYRCETLEKICKMKECFLEKTEKLEQLRWLENGLKIRVVESNDQSYGVDTPADLERLNRMIERGEIKVD